MKLTPTDPRVMRIAKALAEGCDGRSFASDDAKELHRKYEAFGDSHPSLGFGDWRDMAFAEFICDVLNSDVSGQR